MRDKEQNTSVKHLGNLVGHIRDVNTVRFSPSGNCRCRQLCLSQLTSALLVPATTNLLGAGQLLASGGVAGEMFLWKPSTETQKTFGSEESDAGWRSSDVLRLAIIDLESCQTGLGRYNSCFHAQLKDKLLNQDWHPLQRCASQRPCRRCARHCLGTRLICTHVWLRGKHLHHVGCGRGLKEVPLGGSP